MISIDYRIQILSRRWRVQNDVMIRPGKGGGDISPPPLSALLLLFPLLQLAYPLPDGGQFLLQRGQFLLQEFLLFLGRGLGIGCRVGSVLWWEWNIAGMAIETTSPPATTTSECPTSSAAAGETASAHSIPTPSGNGIHVPGHGISRAISRAATRHGACAPRTGSVSAWHISHLLLFLKVPLNSNPSLSARSSGRKSWQ